MSLKNNSKRKDDITPKEAMDFAVKFEKCLKEGTRREENFRKKQINLDPHPEFEVTAWKLGLDLRKLLPGEIYEDSDQSSLTGEKAEAMKSFWSEGLDYTQYASKWLTCLYCGDYKAMMKFLNKLEKDQVCKVLERRESLFCVSAVFHVIIGAMHMLGDNKHLEAARVAAQKVLKDKIKNDHAKILEKLLKLGARPDVHDVAGYTPLHHCVSAFGNCKTLEMAGILIKAGADINAQNRYGWTPLFESVRAMQPDFVSFLLKQGADPHVKEHDKGLTPLTLAAVLPRPHVEQIMQLFGKLNKSVCKTVRTTMCPEVGKCCVCGHAKSQRCTGCYIVWYCGAECQKEDWSKHKASCKETRAQYIPLTISMLDEDPLLNYLSGKLSNHKKEEKPSKSHFVVKVQVPLNPGMKFTPMRIYNKDRSLCGAIFREAQEEVYDKTLKDIKEKGLFGGTKAFFYGLYKKDTETKRGYGGLECLQIQLNTSAMSPSEKL